MSEKLTSEQRYEAMMKRIDEFQTWAKENMVKTQILSEKTLSNPSPSVEKHHFDAKDLDTDCPECKSKIQAFKDGISKAKEEDFKKNIKERSALPLVCEGCGIGVKREEESCPFCDGKRARNR